MDLNPAPGHLDYLEEHAAFSRQGKAGIRQVDTEGLVAAAFVQSSSRAVDPQLHTHVLVSGRVRCGDGEWRALDSRALHRELKTAGMLYQATLRAELSAHLGLHWSEVDRHAQAEVAGVPEGLCRHYSARRKRIEERAAERMAESEVILGRALTPEERRRAYERATLETRTAKVHDDWGRFHCRPAIITILQLASNQDERSDMAKNTGKGYRRGAVRRRTQIKVRAAYVKRRDDGQFMDVKSDGKPFKGVTKEK